VSIRERIRRYHGEEHFLRQKHRTGFAKACFLGSQSPDLYKKEYNKIGGMSQEGIGGFLETYMLKIL